MCSGSFNNFEPCRVKFDLMIKQNKCSQALFDGFTSPVRVLAESRNQIPQVWCHLISHNLDTTGAGMCLTTLTPPSSSLQKQKMLLFLLYHIGCILSSSHCRFHCLQSTVAFSQWLNCKTHTACHHANSAATFSFCYHTQNNCTCVTDTFCLHFGSREDLTVHQSI